MPNTMNLMRMFWKSKLLMKCCKWRWTISNKTWSQRKCQNWEKTKSLLTCNSNCKKVIQETTFQWIFQKYKNVKSFSGRMESLIGGAWLKSKRKNTWEQKLFDISMIRWGKGKYNRNLREKKTYPKKSCT